MSKHLNTEDRREIEALLRQGASLHRIAQRLGKTVSAISQEIKRNSRSKKTRFGKPGEYIAEVASQKAKNRRREASHRHKAILNNPKLRAFIDAALLSFQSPEAIAGRLRTGREKLPYVSRNSIERYLNSVYGEAIRVELAEFKQQYKRRVSRPNKKPTIDGRIFIDERPKEIQDRSRIGDIELDFIVSGKDGRGRLLTASDRRIRKSFLRKLYPVTMENLCAILLQIKHEFPELKSITTDNDILFAQHNTISQLLGIPIYFCNPYHSWEKGSVENLNKFIRRFIRKGSSISSYSSKQIQKIEDLANGRYMKILNYLTPQECYLAETNKTLEC